MTNSILDTVKKMLGIPDTDTAFDVDIIVHINSVFMVLHQLGVGPATVFQIADKTDTWADFLPTDLPTYAAVKTYIYLKVKQMFDPPASSFVLDSLGRQIAEMESRLLAQVEVETYVPPPPPPPEE